MLDNVFGRLLRRGTRGVQTLRRLTWLEWKALGLAGSTVALAAVLLRALPFRRVQALLAGDERASNRPVRLTAEDERRLLWAVTAVSRRFFPDRPCLPQALAAQALLRWHGGRPALLRIGVARSPDDQLQAHAWLERDGTVLLGGDASPEFYSPLSKPT
jgi:hypothetical protein